VCKITRMECTCTDKCARLENTERPPVFHGIAKSDKKTTIFDEIIIYNKLP
jgi:hypothetical protein